MAHSSLMGVMIVFLIFFQKIRSLLIFGALLSAMFSVLLVTKISQKSRLKEDVSIGIVLSFFFSIAIALLTYIQSIPSATQAGLEHYIFGNVAFLLISDL